LFVDGRLIDRLEGATLRLHKPQAANTILKNDKPWEGHHNFGIGVFHHKGQFYLYYRAMPGETFGKHYAAVALSDDGVHWSKPNLGLVEVKGTADNNVVALEDEDGRLQPAATNLDFWLDTNPQAPESERFKLVTYSTNGGPHVPGPTSGENAVHTATFWVSADGFRFRKRDPQPEFSSRLKNSFDSFNVYFWSEAEQQYVGYFRWYDRVRTIARVTSKDLMTWSEPVPMSYGDAPRENLYTNQTEPYFRAPHLYIALPTRFMEGRTGILTEEQFKQLDIAERYKEQARIWNGHPADGAFMTTRPGSTEYDRIFMESFVRPGIGLENWVNRGNYPLRGIVQTGPTEMSLYVNRHYTQASWHIERMTLRLDGFTSVHAPYEGGEMLTRPFTFTGGALAINYSTSVAGNIRIEIQDAEGRPIPGFALKDADDIIGDEISRTVTWGGKSEVSALVGKPIRLRFVLRDADVYSIQFAGDEAKTGLVD
ncbi:MAG: hypothetical protein KY475_19905, partial [Planctomycetes bacterium]|nr:hypothetical protein [Planctomycetota bacterium]